MIGLTRSGTAAMLKGGGGGRQLHLALRLLVAGNLARELRAVTRDDDGKPSRIRGKATLHTPSGNNFEYKANGVMVEYLGAYQGERPGPLTVRSGQSRSLGEAATLDWYQSVSGHRRLSPA